MSKSIGGGTGWSRVTVGPLLVETAHRTGLTPPCRRRLRRGESRGPGTPTWAPSSPGPHLGIRVYTPGDLCGGPPNEGGLPET